jgi:hypothetical protein
LPPCPVKDCLNDVVDNKYAVEKNDSAADKKTMILMLFIMMQLARKSMHLIVDILLVFTFRNCLQIDTLGRALDKQKESKNNVETYLCGVEYLLVDFF